MSDQLTETDFQFIRHWMRTHVGQDLGEDKQYLVKVAVADIQARYQLPSISHCIRRLESLAPPSPMFNFQAILDSGSTGGRFVQDMVDALMVGETYFFRRPSTFDDLRQFVLPALIRNRQAQKRLRIWSAACSTGQEPYSLAMTLADYFPEVFRTWDLLIVASDISQKAIDKSKAGTFSDWEVARGLDVARRDRYFTREGANWVARNEIKSPIRFSRCNLVSQGMNIPYRPFDLILLRNVLIYFDMQKKKEILGTVRDHLLDDGYLLLGESETLLGLEDHFQISDHAPALCEPKGLASFR